MPPHRARFCVELAEFVGHPRLGPVRRADFDVSVHVCVGGVALFPHAIHPVVGLAEPHGTVVEVEVGAGGVNKPPWTGGQAGVRSAAAASDGVASEAVAVSCVGHGVGRGVVSGGRGGLCAVRDAWCGPWLLV